MSTEYKPWEHDHTALVHVLWAAERAGITGKPDELASHIMRSRWFAAVQAEALTAGQEQSNQEGR